MSGPNLRSRTAAPIVNPDEPISTPPKRTLTQLRAEDASSFSLLDILRVVGGVLLLNTVLSYFITGDSVTWGYPRPVWTRPVRIKAWWEGPLNLTDAQLLLYNGTNPHLPILLALNSTIYDVTISPHLYGPGGSYHPLAGRDATRAFLTGCFDSDLTGDLRGVEEMYIPISSDHRADGGLTKEERRERKMKRERDIRVAKGKVREGVEGWRKLFDGGKEGGYFVRGRVWRGEGSGFEGWGEVRELCEGARERRTADEVVGT